jgi:peptidylprolyl isomerase/FKBP-type peptidyl-prolyl cis-trans isomerase FklB
MSSRPAGVWLLVLCAAPFLAPAQSADATADAAVRQYLERNARKPGVITTPSGLQYKILAPGNPKAESPLPTDEVTLRYRGTLADGTEFDSSARHNGSTSIAVGTSIKGWQEALVLMKPGARWMLWVPPELGYGIGARPALHLPGGTMLIYELQLQSIAHPRLAASAGAVTR